MENKVGKSENWLWTATVVVSLVIGGFAGAWIFGGEDISDSLAFNNCVSDRHEIATELCISQSLSTNGCIPNIQKDEPGRHLLICCNGVRLIPDQID